MLQVAQLPLEVRDGKWHHICICWTTRDGQWDAYQDGDKLGAGDNLAAWHPIKPGGVIILGQEQVAGGHRVRGPEGQRSQGQGFVREPLGILCSTGGTGCDSRLLKVFKAFQFRQNGNQLGSNPEVKVMNSNRTWLTTGSRLKLVLTRLRTRTNDSPW